MHRKHGNRALLTRMFSFHRVRKRQVLIFVLYERESVCKSMPVSSTKMVFLAYFGGNLLNNGVKLIRIGG
jgi:hypothetical protein